MPRNLGVGREAPEVEVAQFERRPAFERSLLAGERAVTRRFAPSSSNLDEEGSERFEAVAPEHEPPRAGAPFSPSTRAVSRVSSRSLGPRSRPRSPRPTRGRSRPEIACAERRRVWCRIRRRRAHPTTRVSRPRGRDRGPGRPRRSRLSGVDRRSREFRLGRRGGAPPSRRPRATRRGARSLRRTRRRGALRTLTSTPAWNAPACMAEPDNKPDERAQTASTSRPSAS